MIAELHLVPTDPNNPKEDFTKRFCSARNESFMSDIKKFVDYLHARYDGDKYFNVLDRFKREADRMVENRKIGWLNQRPPIPEPLASLASFATRFEGAQVALDYYEKNGWSLGIYTEHAFGAFHFHEHENPVTDKSREDIYRMFGKLHEKACRPIENLFYVQAEVVTNEIGEDEYSSKDYIVSPPFASKPEAENYLKMMTGIYDYNEKNDFVKAFLPPETNIDYVEKGKVIGHFQ